MPRIFLVVLSLLVLASPTARAAPPDPGPAEHSPAITTAAQLGPTASDAQQWPIVVALGLGLGALLVRRLAPRSHWAHSPAGLVLLSLLAGALEAAAQAIGAVGLHALPIAVAVVSALLAQLDPRPAPVTTGASGPELQRVAILLLAGGMLSQAACAAGWRERLGERADHAAAVAGAAVDCYAPELAPLVPRALVAVVLTVLDPAGAALRFGELLEQARTAVASPAALACAIAALREASGGERTATGTGGTRIAAATGIRGDQAERLVDFAWWAGARDDLPRVARRAAP